ncbi:MAG: hypothetical protein LBP23_08910 [Treponema sp.]|jgi:hypothetical protein|nr:hypothetical protein [Treponema sp.]
MKKKTKVCAAGDFPPAPEEYRLFGRQPEKVLACYSLAKHCMAIIMPLSALAAVYSFPAALALSLTGGAIGFPLLRKKYGVKGALVPFLCLLTGATAGFFVLSPLFSHVTALKEAYGGI